MAKYYPLQQVEGMNRCGSLTNINPYERNKKREIDAASWLY